MKWLSFTDVYGDFFLRNIDDLQSVERIRNEDTSKLEYFICFSGYNEYDEYCVPEDVYKNILDLLKSETTNLSRPNYSINY